MYSAGGAASDNEGPGEDWFLAGSFSRGPGATPAVSGSLERRAQPPVLTGVATLETGTVPSAAITRFQSKAGPKSHLP